MTMHLISQETSQCTELLVWLVVTVQVYSTVLAVVMTPTRPDCDCSYVDAAVSCIVLVCPVCRYGMFCMSCTVCSYL